jgi:inositol transporter-like SP family MFS transporter
MSTQMATTQRANRPWKTAFLAGMASYLDAGAIVTTGIALVLYQHALNLSNADIGILSGLLTFCFAIGALIGGQLGDRFGRRRVFSVSLLLYALGAAILTAAVHSYMLYVGVILVGSAIGADLPVSLALIAEESPEGMKGRLVVFSELLWLAGIIVTIILASIFAPLGPLAARIFYGHLLLVALVIVILRLGLRESMEWAAVKQAKAEGDDAIRFSAIPQLFTPPLLFTVLAVGLYYALWNLTANSFGQFGAFIFVNVAHSTVQLQSLLTLVLLPLGLVGAALHALRRQAVAHGLVQHWDDLLYHRVRYPGHFRRERASACCDPGVGWSWRVFQRRSHLQSVVAGTGADPPSQHGPGLHHGLRTDPGGPVRGDHAHAHYCQ